MDDLFADIGTASEEALIKSLMAGGGTDAALFTGGRALIGEDCEITMVNAMREQMEDFKLMNTLKKRDIATNIHQFNVRLDTGNADVGFVGEGWDSPENNQDIVRIIHEAKYIQKKGCVTEQARIFRSFQDVFVEEKLATTISVLRTAEKFSFHGDSAVVPKQFDGLLSQVKRVPAAKRNALDVRGKSIPVYGDKIFTEMAEMIADKGGSANKVFYPLILGGDIQALCQDRLRFGTGDSKMTAVWQEYPTLHGTIKIAGNEAGPDKLFFPKGKVKPGGIVDRLPNPPTAVTASVASAPNSQFLTSDAGDYRYTVHAVNEAGTSDGKALAAPVSAASGMAVTLAITPDPLKPGTGFIICRSAKNGTEVMEMARTGIDTQNTTTAYIDANEDLPGTAEMLFITESKVQTVAEFFQLLPLRLYQLQTFGPLVTPFIMTLWGTPVLKVPQWCGAIKNIQYR
jgi:hypothetical protein